jgi:hypothetical protein
MIIISELVSDAEEWNVANTNYGLLTQIRKKVTGNVIHTSRLYNRYLNRNQVNLNRENFCNDIRFC